MERHPRLRIGIVELSAVWVPLFLLMLDGYRAQHCDPADDAGLFGGKLRFLLDA